MEFSTQDVAYTVCSPTGKVSIQLSLPLQRVRKNHLPNYSIIFKKSILASYLALSSVASSALAKRCPDRLVPSSFPLSARNEMEPSGCQTRSNRALELLHISHKKMLLKQLFSNINCLYISPLVLAGLNSAAGLQGEVPILHRPEKLLTNNILHFLAKMGFFPVFYLMYHRLVFGSYSSWKVSWSEISSWFAVTSTPRWGRILKLKKSNFRMGKSFGYHFLLHEFPPTFLTAKWRANSKQKKSKKKSILLPSLHLPHCEKWSMKSLFKKHSNRVKYHCFSYAPLIPPLLFFSRHPSLSLFRSFL